MQFGAVSTILTHSLISLLQADRNPSARRLLCSSCTSILRSVSCSILRFVRRNIRPSASLCVRRFFPVRLSICQSIQLSNYPSFCPSSTRLAVRPNCHSVRSSCSPLYQSVRHHSTTHFSRQLDPASLALPSSVFVVSLAGISLSPHSWHSLAGHSLAAMHGEPSRNEVVTSETG